jgi:FkbM family methyltransferase
VRSVYGPYLIDDRGDYTHFVNVIGGHGNFLADRLKKLSKPFVFVDIGANQGIFSLIAANNANCTSVFSFEPVGRIMSFLRGNAVLNGVEDKICFVEKAVSSDSGAQEIFYISGHSGSGSLRNSPGDIYDQKLTIATINGKELAELLGESKQEIFCKIDVEGHEPQVVQELLSQPEISKRLTTLFIECDESWFDVSKLIERLKNEGFVIEKVGRGAHFDVFAYRSSDVSF